MYHTFVKNSDPALLVENKEIRNRLDLKKGKPDFYHKCMHINGQKKMCDMINQLMSRKQTSEGAQEIQKDNDHVDVQEFADQMNCHFVNVRRHVGDDTCADTCLRGHSLPRSRMHLPSTPAEKETISA